MKRMVGSLLITLCLIIGNLPVSVFAAAAPVCSLCILEVGARGMNGQEDQDFVIVANVTASSITSSGIQLRYYNSAGVLDSTLGVGTFTAGQTKIYANDTLKDLNPSSTKLTLPLFSGGGRLQLARSTSTTTTIYDQISWGTANGGEGLSAAEPPVGTTIARKLAVGVVVDTNQNMADFEPVVPDCQGAEITEIQPFVTDQIGQTIDAWVELKGLSEEKGDCKLINATGDIYIVPAENMPDLNELTHITQAINSNNEVVPLHIGEGSGRLWLAGTSAYGGANPVHLPFTDQAFTNMVKGQSWALIDTIWQRTYALTPGNLNVYQANVSLPVEDETACHDVRISELLPNPTGEDTGHEWLELHNESTEPASLEQCVITIDDDTYYFLPDDILGANEWRMLNILRDSEGSEKTISLRNSDETLVVFGRQLAAGTELIQSFNYSNAPEGQSWSRMNDGWHWQSPTQGFDNTLEVTNTIMEPTEFAAHVSEEASGLNTPITLPALPISITELLPNPKSPQTDEADEFIELYNPNNETVALRGYKLQSGNSYSYSFTFTDQEIPAGGYIVITSAGTNLSQSNSTGRARLIDPNGAVMSETEIYEDAPEGQSWVFTDGIWKWSGTPTAGEANKVTVPIFAAATKALAKKVSAATAKATKAKTTKAAAVKAAKTTKAKEDKPKLATAQNSKKQVSPIHPLVLAGVGGLAIAYAGYEYRQDVRNKLHQLRSNRAARRAARK